MKRIPLSTLSAATSFSAFADAPGGADYGQGSMLFKGQRGVATYVVAAITNGTSDNNAFGMTTGTNGCHTNGALSYGGEPLPMLDSMMDKLSKDMAKGNGEALITYAVVLDVRPQDHEHFAAIAHEHFSEIFNKSNATAADVYADTQAILKQDTRLARYTEQA